MKHIVGTTELKLNGPYAIREQSMTTTRDWSHNREMWIRVLEKQTSRDLEYWNARIKKKKVADASVSKIGWPSRT